MTAFKPVKLSYKVFEAKEGSNPNLSPVIFLHGVTATKENWEDIPQIVAERTKRKAIAYDARNHGGSEYSDEFSFDLNVDDLFHLMDTMNIPKAIIIGHSMGGLTTAHAALKQPERFEMMISEDIHIKPPSQSRVDNVISLITLRHESLKNIPKGLDETEAKKFIADFMFERIPDNVPLLFKKEDLYKVNMQLKKTADERYELDFNVNTILRALKSAETLLTPPSGIYKGPSYFLYGTESPIRVDAEEEHIKKHFPNADFIAFEGATHRVHSEEKEKFTETIIKCIQN